MISHRGRSRQQEKIVPKRERSKSLPAETMHLGFAPRNDEDEPRVCSKCKSQYWNRQERAKCRVERESRRLSNRHRMPGTVRRERFADDGLTVMRSQRL